MVSEKHICMLRGPGSSYVGHVSPKTGSSKHISAEILELLTSDSNSSYLRAIGCDGTNVNNGTTNGVIVGLERALKSPLQWIVCQLQANELPLRHLMQKLNGKTNGPAGFTGKIGKALKDCEKLPVNVHFNPIPTELITVDCDDLSTTKNICLKYTELHRKGGWMIQSLDVTQELLTILGGLQQQTEYYDFM